MATAMEGSPFSSTLSTITTTKLIGLAKQRRTYESQKLLLIQNVQQETDELAKTRMLATGVIDCCLPKVTGSTSSSGRKCNDRKLQDMIISAARFLEQARYDPAISLQHLKTWQTTLHRQLDMRSLKYQYVTLFGTLTNEYLEDEQGSLIPANSTMDEDSDMVDYHKEIRQDQREHEREKWRALAFEAAKVDQQAFKLYLDKLFQGNDNSKTHEAFTTLRVRVSNFCDKLLETNHFSPSSLRWVIAGLLKSDLLSNENRIALQDFSQNELILEEISDVLNMRLAVIKDWSWEGEVTVEQRRQVNGRYDIYMHEDLLQAMFLHLIGVKFSTKLKRYLVRFMKSEGVWHFPNTEIPEASRRRREYFLGGRGTFSEASIGAKRTAASIEFFMSQLMNSKNADAADEDGIMEAQCAPAPAPAAPRKRTVFAARKVPTKRKHALDDDSTTDTEDEFEDSLHDTTTDKTPMERKQKVLHLISTEITVNAWLDKDFTVFRSDFNDIESSMPHSTVFNALAELGISEVWLQFFRKFLQAPLKFQDEPESLAEVQVRGVPKSHALSTFLMESVMFFADLAVNRVAEGAQLVRSADDFWLWSTDHEICVKAWATLERFAQVTGLTIDKAKSGAVRLKGPVHASLPSGRVRWGFLYLDAANGRFTIDQAIVDEHISKLRSQLEAKRSVFAWIQAWNISAGRFFTTNFGTPANCFGRDHVDDMLNTFSRIQHSIFSSSGSVVTHLKSLLHDRFGVSSIPDGHLFFPTQLGGLELQNPFVPLLLIRDSITHSPSELLEETAKQETEAYGRAKLAFKSRASQRLPADDPAFKAEDKHTFFSFEEFTRYREDIDMGHHRHLGIIFDELMSRPKQKHFDLGQELDREVSNLADLRMGGPIVPGVMTPYWKWIVSLYGPEIVELFGGLNIVDPGLLPIAMVTMFRSRRVKWQG